MSPSAIIIHLHIFKDLSLRFIPGPKLIPVVTLSIPNYRSLTPFKGGENLLTVRKIYDRFFCREFLVTAGTLA